MEIDQELSEKSAENTQRWWKLTATIWCKGFNPFNAGTVFIRQNLTSIDVRFYRRQILTYTDGPRTERVNIYIEAVDP